MNKLIESIYSSLNPLIPSDSKGIVFYAIYEPGSFSMKFYVKGNNKYYDCFDITEKTILTKTFKEINKIISEERKELSDKDCWTVMTVTINDAGKAKIVFDYSDEAINDEIEYLKKWKSKYLK